MKSLWNTDDDEDDFLLNSERAALTFGGVLGCKLGRFIGVTDGQPTSIGARVNDWAVDISGVIWIFLNIGWVSTPTSGGGGDTPTVDPLQSLPTLHNEIVPGRLAWSNNTYEIDNSIMYLTYLNGALRFETIGSVACVVNDSSDTTVAKVGIYSVDTTTGNLTLLTSGSNPLMFAGPDKSITPLDAPFIKNRGNSYAIGVIWMGTDINDHVGPQLCGYMPPGLEMWAEAPRICGVINGVGTTLPATALGVSVEWASVMIGWELMA